MTDLAPLHQYDLFVDERVVAPPFRPKADPGWLPKANAAIHVEPIEGTYSVVMRRTFNALLALSYDTLNAAVYEDAVRQSKVVRFEADALQLCRLIGWAGKDSYSGLYAAMDALLGLKVEWNSVLLETKEVWRHRATLLSQWARTEEPGKVAWLWVPDVFSMLFSPERTYTRLDLSLCKQFHSRYTLALYENVYRYHNLGKTPLWPVDKWRALVPGRGRFPDYREFKRSSLMLAMDEIRNTPTCPVYFELFEERGARNRVNRLQFIIKRKHQPALAMDIPATVDPAFAERLSQLLRLSDRKANEVVAKFDKQDLERALDQTLLRMTRPRNGQPLSNPAGYFLSLLQTTGGASAPAEPAAALTTSSVDVLASTVSQESVEEQWHRFRTLEALQWFSAQSTAVQQMLHQSYLDQCSPALRHVLQRHGPQSRAWTVAWQKWLVSQPGALSNPAALDFERYKSAMLSTELARDD